MSHRAVAPAHQEAVPSPAHLESHSHRQTSTPPLTARTAMAVTPEQPVTAFRTSSTSFPGTGNRHQTVHWRLHVIYNQPPITKGSPRAPDSGVCILTPPSLHPDTMLRPSLVNTTWQSGGSGIVNW